jgi:predicted TIM-barrel fold metal-dependent hydrolase
MEYMSRGWQEHLMQPVRMPGGSGRPLPILPLFPYRRPAGDKLPDSRPSGGPPGSNVDLLLSQAADAHGVERVVLSHDEAIYAACIPNPHLAREAIRAINRWTAERWLGYDERLYALAVVPTQTPEDGAAEIRRVADNPRFIGVLLGANALGKSFGHPVYNPIYEAAAECALPIVIQAGTDAPNEVLSATAGGGTPGTYAEYSIFRPQALMSHLVSFIGQGVFERFPNLKLLVTGGGVGWIPGLLWRYDTEYRALRRETPWVTRMPSEIFRDHIRVATFPLDEPTEPSQLSSLLNGFEGIEQVLVFGSGYPDWDADTPASITDRIPPNWRESVFFDNALELFRWSGQPATPVVPVDAHVGAMD